MDWLSASCRRSTDYEAIMLATLLNVRSVVARCD